MEKKRSASFIFISYAHADRVFAERLKLDLLTHGVHVWIDQEGIIPGTPDWEDVIRIALRDAHAVIFIASPEARKSRYVKDELRIAETFSYPIYPVWAEGDQWINAAPLGFGGAQYIDARAKNYEAALPVIVESVRKTLITAPMQQNITSTSPSSTGRQLLSQPTSRRIIIGVITGLVLSGAGATWWTLAHVSPHLSQKRQTLSDPPLALYKEHTEPVWRVAWSPDGRRIASGGGDKTVQLWYAYSGRWFYTYHGHGNNNVRGIAWSPDSRFIASGGDDKVVQVWDSSSGKRICTYTGHISYIWDIAWSPDGTRVASASWDKTVQVWHALTGKHIYTYHGHTDTVRSIAWSPDSRSIVSASRDLLVRVWEANTGKSIASYGEHPTDTLLSVTWSPKNNFIASAGWDKTVQVWDALTAEHIYTYQGHSSAVLGVSWSPNAIRLASAGWDRTVQVWDALTGNHKYTYPGHTDKVYSVSWSPDGKYIASGSADKTVQVWLAR